MAKDMTHGNLAHTLVSFSLPLIFSGLLQQLYSWADAFIVGNIEGERSLAAIGSTSTIVNLFVMVITGFTVGVSVLSAQQFGRGNKQYLKKILSSFVLVFSCAFLLIGVLGIVLAGFILKSLHTPQDIYEIAKNYLQIILLGIPFIAIYNVYSAVLRGIGDSKAPFLSVFVSSVTNVFLDILFVGVFRYGAEGAAVATVISQILMTLFVICYSIKKYEILRFHFKKDMIDKSALSQGFRLGVPPALQSSVSSLGNLALQNVMNGFGTQTVVAITTAYRVDSVIMLPIVNLGSAISTVVAQNAGAGKRKRTKNAFVAGMLMMLVVSVLLTLLVISVGESLIAMFGVTEESVIIGRNFFHIIARFYIVYGLAMSIRGFLEGVGDVLYSSLAGVVSLGLRIIVSYSLASLCGNMIIAYAEALSWGILLLMYIPRYISRQRDKEH